MEGVGEGGGGGELGEKEGVLLFVVVVGRGGGAERGVEGGEEGLDVEELGDFLGGSGFVEFEGDEGGGFEGG